MKKSIVMFFILSGSLAAQQTDSTIVFATPNQELLIPVKSEMHDAWGVDILLSNNGFGLAGFYRREFSRDLFGTITLGIAESKDDNEVEYVNYWGQSFTPGKINRFLFIPMFVGVQYRLFADDIMDSFRPYINAGLGPTLILAAPYNREWFNSWGYARSHYTAGGFVGIGAFFGSDMGSLSGINIRYYFVPYSDGILSLQDPSGRIGKKNEFGGFFITINLGSAF